MSDVEMGIAFPLDNEGFLRRECPTCEREFKWLPTEEEGEAVPPADGGYFCPYCGIQAPPEAWLTKPQVALVEAVVERDVIGPALDQFGRDLKRIERQSGGMIKVTTQRDRPEEPDPLTEADDMKRVNLDCHPTEPVKVLDDWDREVRCLVCGQPRAVPSP
jgi:DNA-directed RNA polymerase subunit RPC12/RpoP